MIVLHPNSVCDVCLESYGDGNVPHSIKCGHVFCLRCLSQLNRPCCPLCRMGFDTEDVRKLHVDRTSKPGTPIRIDSTAAVSELDEMLTPSASLQTRITRIVLDGGKASDVRDLIEEVRNWLSTHPSDEHSNLRAAYLLLFKYTDLQYKVKEEKNRIADLTREYEDLKEEIREERELTDAKYQELSQKRMDEMETAMNVERSLRDRIDQVEQGWKDKYNVCLEEYRRLKEELKRSKHNPLPPPPRTVDAPFSYSAADRDSPVPEAMDDDDVVVERPRSADRAKDDRFQLSPIPATATLPVSDLPNRQNFRPLTAEESDVEDFKSKRTNPYLLRSIDPIPISRPGVQRMNSSSSILSRSGYDSGVPRSLPRSSVDVHMASCSSSPIASLQYSPRDRDEPMTGSVGITHDSFRSLTRRATVGPYVREQEEQQERAKKLSDVLDRRNALPMDTTPPRPSQKRDPSYSPPGSRNVSPVSSVNIQSSLLQPPPEAGSRASTAALQAERARAMSLKDSSIHTMSPTTATPNRDTSVHQSTASHYQPRRPSVGSMRGKSASTVPVQTASGLTRSLWGMHEPQKV